jgi:tetratricopeptide (TPR) repeat protein
MELSLCIIIKPTDDEAKLLERCLKYVAPYVDEICITQAGKTPNPKVSEVIKSYNGKESFFEWVNDFAKARNYNFSQATGDYIFWLDTDDVVKGAEKLKPTVEKMAEMKVDVGVMFYLYDFDENGVCRVKHLKTRIVKNDGCVEWVGKIHEDFDSKRTLDSFFIEGIEVLHITSKTRVEDSAQRNYMIAKETLKKNPSDPRSFWLMANACMMVNKIKDAEKYWLEFIKRSKSEEEVYLAYLQLGDLLKNEDYYLKALAIRPAYPNAYLKLGELMFNRKKYAQALNFTELGVQMPIPDKEIIYFNPRDYDYNPMMVMVKIYYEMGQHKKAVMTLERMTKMFPSDEPVKKLYEAIRTELGEALNADKYMEAAKKITDKDELKKYLDNLPEKVASHPQVCHFRNQHFYKETSSGKDLVIYCSYTSKFWNPVLAETKGIGGSEEAVIQLAKRLAKDWNVTVYNNCQTEGNYDGVEYKHFWKYNIRDKQDATILWRHPKPCDYDLNSEKIFIDLHDVIPEAEFTAERLKKIDKIFVKTKAHRDLFPNIPDEKFAIIPNGVDPKDFDEKVEKNPYLIINTSSPDRHLDATLDVFEELIRRQPDKPWKLAWYYGWGVYNDVHANDKAMMDWKQKQTKRFYKLVNKDRAEGGFMIGHKEIAKKYLEAGIFLYPTQFYEIHCISAVKAQLANCKCVTSDAFALNETIKYGHKIHTKAEKWETESTFGDPQTEKYVEGILADAEIVGQQEWAKETYNWDKIANEWNSTLQSLEAKTPKETT